jgi:hypothetical protein
MNLSVKAGEAHTFEARNLLPDAVPSFKISAINGRGTESWSSTLSSTAG